MESLIERSTLVCRGVSPVASGGPSGSSLTLRLLFVMIRTVRRQALRFHTPVRTACRPIGSVFGLVGRHGPGGDLVQADQGDRARGVAQHLDAVADQL